VAAFSGEKGDFNAIHAANYRMVADLINMESTYEILDTVFLIFLIKNRVSLGIS